MTALWRTLRGRLALASLVGLLIATIAFTALGLQLTRSQTYARERDDLDAKARGIASLVSGEFAADIQSQGGLTVSPERIRVLESIAGTGTDLVYMGPKLNPAGEPTLPRDVIEQVDLNVLQRDGIQRIAYTDDAGTARMASAAPLRFQGETVGAIVLARERSAISSLWRRVGARVVVAGIVGLLAALATSLLLTARVLRPLRRLQGAAIDVGQGDLETRVDAGGTEEIDAVAAAFNTMVRELRHRDQISREFLMRVTHDLRTPLTAIRGHTQALADGVVPAEMVPRSLAAIDDESQRLAAMVTDLLDMSKLDAGRLRMDLANVDATELVRRVFDAHMGAATARQVEFRSEIDELGEMVTDPNRVQQILANVIENAFRWAGAGGTVAVEATAAGGGIEMAVADSGPGVPPALHEEIFTAFRSEITPDGEDGSGLGLAISRQLARALGGDLRLDADVTAGARFVLTLPRRSTDRGAAPSAKRAGV